MTNRYLRRAAPPPDFVSAVVDPVVNAVACATGSARQEENEAPSAERTEVVQRALGERRRTP